MKCITRQVAVLNVMKTTSLGLLMSGFIIVIGTFGAPSALANGFIWSSDTYGSLDAGAGSRFSSSQMAVTIPLERQKSGNEAFNSDVHLDITTFRWTGTTAASGEYFWLSAPIYYRQMRTSGTEIHVKFEPGLMTDLDAIGTENLTANIELSGRSYTGRTSFFQYGVVVNREFGDRNPRPLLAYATRLTNATEMWLGFPRTNIQTRWSSDVSTYFRVYPSGGFWREEVDGLVPVKVTDIAYSNWHVGVGSELHWRDNIWFSVEIGQLRNRSVSAIDATGLKVRATPADNGYWQLGGSLRF